MHTDTARWDARHRSAEPSTPAPPDALADRADLLALVPTTGRAVDIACGTGRQTLWLAQRGLDVLALDISPVAIASTSEAARRAGVEHRVTALVVDLDDGLPAEFADVDLIVCQRFRQPALYPRMVGALVSGGLGIVTVLSQVGATEPGPFHAAPRELAAAFTRPDTRLLLDEEGEGQATVVFRRR